jgi:hypothetical protein
MSKSMTLDVPDDVYDRLCKSARSAGQPVEQLATALLSKSAGAISVSREKTGTLEDLMHFAGAADGGDPDGSDNDKIDRDLLKDYERGLDETD